MANELSRTYTASDGQELTLNPNIVAKYILGNIDKVPDEEYAKVIMTCAARGLNPLAGDVTVQPHWNKNRGCNELSMVVTKDYFQRRAESHPSYDGKEYGVVVLSGDGGRIIRRDGCAFYPSLGEKLLSGWCRVHVKGHAVPEYAEAPLGEYTTGKALWSSKPATMIAKVAKSQALREAFPNEFQGLYEPEEMGMDVNADGDVVRESAVLIESGNETVRIPVYDDMQVAYGVPETPEPVLEEGWEAF